MHRFCSLYQNYSITNWSELNPEDTIDTLMEDIDKQIDELEI